MATELSELAGIRDDSLTGWTREVFTEPYRDSRQWVQDAMRGAGLDVHVDGAGNIVGRLAGSTPGAPPIVTGSHTDTVTSGGRFDGIVGVLGGIETARRLRENSIRLTHDLIVIDFLGEEPNEFGLSCLGSRTLAGELTAADLDRVSLRGISLGERYASFGLDPGAVISNDWARTGALHGYVELHIEQGPTLEERGIPVGIVTAIAGIERLVATFRGRADHAGTRSMESRQDAMVAAAEAVLAVRREGCSAPVHGVATTTQVRSLTDSPNVVPSLVTMRSEVRSIDPGWLSGTRRRLAEEIQASANETGVDVEFDWTHDNDVVQTTDDVQDIAGAAATSIGAQWMPIPSGATHDAVHMARLTRMGMIFIPSHDGKSHCPEEWTDASDISTGIRVLADTILRLDGQ
ncbi:M20 family metallo-hydrolase [Rathayibacter soli]|uniref:M20 family metallo-hydrolase n=1 Tax=Rathayibacter soli TaxID=3144168 RepID=UPI0027E4BAC7|nr:M20 family metallo-hydrolase [Glaciibacter superstes]